MATLYVEPVEDQRPTGVPVDHRHAIGVRAGGVEVGFWALEDAEGVVFVRDDDGARLLLTYSDSAVNIACGDECEIGVRGENPALDRWFPCATVKTIVLALGNGSARVTAPEFVDQPSASSRTFAAPTKMRVAKAA